MKQIIPALILALTIISCQSHKGGNAMYDMANVEMGSDLPVTKREASIPPQPTDKIEKQEVIKKKIIKDGRLGIKVTDLTNTKLRVDSLIKLHGGYYANENFNNTDWESSYNLKIRVPSINFEKLITVIETGESEILYKEIDAHDVTDQFIDLETRLENKRNYLNRYNELLKQAKTIKEILDIEEKIRGLEEEIESTTGRLTYLNDLVDYSTLDLTISKRKPFRYNPANRDKFSERLKQSLSKGWFGFVDFILFVIKIWPFCIIVTLFVYFWRKYKKRK